MFFLGVVPALLTLFLLVNVKESEAWKAAAATKKSWGEYFSVLKGNGKRFLYLVLLMTMMNFLSHGTQDLYPTFLRQQRHLIPGITTIISVISMMGGNRGGVLIGLYSDRRGRRRAMVTVELAALILIPLWIFVPQIAWIAVGAFFMQFMVQGAWGVIPEHINELSPDKVRGFLPGFAYQTGVLIAASAPYIEALMTKHFHIRAVDGGVYGNRPARLHDRNRGGPRSASRRVWAEYLTIGTHTRTRRPYELRERAALHE